MNKVLTNVRSVNKTDVIALLDTFGSFSGDLAGSSRQSSCSSADLHHQSHSMSTDSFLLNEMRMFSRLLCECWMAMTNVAVGYHRHTLRETCYFPNPGDNCTSIPHFTALQLFYDSMLIFCTA